ncbi:MAG TPA: GTP cyclohydrolase I FolE [Nitrospinota bacterium]|jgi:GTP cyclohydrolase I|nr:GTP cyclohydrolase I FolE [Nitrospinota bacterium]
MEDLIRELLTRLGEDPDREGLSKTPHRTSKSLKFLTKGYKQDVDKILNDALYDVEYNEMVLVKNIDVYSLCEHHLLPFFGKCHVGYIPNKKIVGLSKIPRIVDILARRLQVQERLTQQIAKTLDEALKPQGVGVVLEAKHLCMMMRGIEEQNTTVVTSSMLGVFLKDQRTRMEFMNLIQNDKRTV